MDEINQIFGINGLLSQVLPGFVVREGQLKMAQAVFEAIKQRQPLMIDAGTGTGKTFAYLIPALLSDDRVLISTATKHLQDQLFHHDLPRIQQVVGHNKVVKLLKGRSNYICLYHLELAEQQGQLFRKEDANYLPLIRRFAERSDTGDRSDLAVVPEDSTIWPLVTSTKENCLGVDCPEVKRCFVLDARKSALNADLIVINHHLFFADMLLKDTGMAELLPSVQTLIFDEAHEIPEIATQFLGESISMWQIIDWSRDVSVQGSSLVRDAADWSSLAMEVEHAARVLRTAEKADSMRLNRDMLLENSIFLQLLNDLIQSLNRLNEALTLSRDRDVAIANLSERGQNLLSALEGWLPSRKLSHQRHQDFQDILETQSKSEQNQLNQQDVFWAEFFSKNWQLHKSPLNVNQRIQKQVMQHGGTWIFTSATLADTNASFDYFAGQIGISSDRSLLIESPFDYKNQGVLCVPEGLPHVSDEGFYEKLIKHVYPLVQVAGGRTVILTTTLRAIDLCRQELERLVLQQDNEDRQPDAAHRGLDSRTSPTKFEIFSQGQRSKSILIEQFSQTPNSILIGSQSFWVGVDLPGERLTVLVIDKLPFAPPGDPIMEAKIANVRRAGGNPFNLIQIPRALWVLKQGVGRLIRTQSDYGVIVIGDERLVVRGYGKMLINALPRFSRTRDIHKAVQFLQSKMSKSDADLAGIK